MILTHSGFTLAEIDEYTGKIELKHPLAQTRVYASNQVENTSVYPEIQVLYSGEAVFRQFVNMPEGEITLLDGLTGLENSGIYLDILDEDNYSSYRIPLGVPYNPGSVSVYRSDDANKTALMTIFRDGRVHIDANNYRLLYRSSGDDTSLVLIDIITGAEIAQFVYHMEASYILN